MTLEPQNHTLKSWWPQQDLALGHFNKCWCWAWLGAVLAPEPPATTLTYYAVHKQEQTWNTGGKSTRMQWTIRLKRVRKDWSSIRIRRLQASKEKPFKNVIYYSPSKEYMFCFVCRLFGKSENASKFCSCGFRDWKHAGEHVVDPQRFEGPLQEYACLDQQNRGEGTNWFGQHLYLSISKTQIRTWIGIFPVAGLGKSIGLT